MQPLEEFLETSVRQDCFHRTEGVAKLVMTPSLVDEILAGMARRHDLGSAFAARHDVMSPRGTCRLQNAHESAIESSRKHNEPPQLRKWRKKWESHPRQVKPAAWPSARSFQGGVLVYAGLLPVLAEGARFALAMG